MAAVRPAATVAAAACLIMVASGPTTTLALQTVPRVPVVSRESRGGPARAATVPPDSVADTPPEAVPSGDGTAHDSASTRLYRARLRLAEAQGRLPPGLADVAAAVKVDSGLLLPASLETIDLEGLPDGPLVSRVRDYNFTRVAAAEVAYDPELAEKTLFRQPLRWLKRNVELFVPLAGFALSVLGDLQRGEELANRRTRARELEGIIAGLGPAIIKGGQALASRPDLLPAEYLEELQYLQDRLPTFPKEEAFALVESELGVPFDSVFELVELEPIAAASIGQVFKARLVANGNLVAVKIQRPGCEEIIATDLYIMRFYASVLTRLIEALGRKIDLVSVIDDFGELIYREIDYQAEAANARRFADLYATIPDVFIPRIYPDLCTTKVLTMEWVEGVRLVEGDRLRAMGFSPERLVETLVQCSLRQMLENGFFHADPHAGNLLATPEGKLCYLDFGMMSYVETYQRYSIIEAVVHLVNRDFLALAALYKRMGFIPPDEDETPIVVALEDALPDVLDASVGELNLKNVINKLGDVMYQFPFSLPPFYIAIIRCLGVLEGLAIQVDRDFRIITTAYPYISSRLLTDPSPELQSALQQLLFKEGKPRWERLEQLLSQASATRDYDATEAVQKLLDYIVSPRGAAIREQLVMDVINGVDEISDETARLLADVARTGVLPSFDDMDSPRLKTASSLANAVAQSRGFELAKVLPILSRLASEPASQQAGVDISSAVSERLVSRAIRWAFDLPPPPAHATTDEGRRESAVV